MLMVLTSKHHPVLHPNKISSINNYYRSIYYNYNKLHILLYSSRF